MTSRQAFRRCIAAGWSMTRQKGSHVAFTKDGAPRPIIIPANKKDLPDYVVRNMERQIKEAEDDDG